MECKLFLSLYLWNAYCLFLYFYGMHTVSPIYLWNVYCLFLYIYGMHTVSFFIFMECILSLSLYLWNVYCLFLYIYGMYTFSFFIFTECILSLSLYYDSFFPTFPNYHIRHFKTIFESEYLF